MAEEPNKTTGTPPGASSTPAPDNKNLSTGAPSPADGPKEPLQGDKGQSTQAAQTPGMSNKNQQAQPKEAPEAAPDPNKRHAYVVTAGKHRVKDSKGNWHVASHQKGESLWLTSAEAQKAGSRVRSWREGDKEPDYEY